MYNGVHASSHSHKSAASYRQSQLIKRATASNDFRPSDLLIERFEVWKSVCSSLLIFFKGLTEVQEHTSRELQRMGTAIQESLPFHSSLFLAEGGLQDILYGVRDHTRTIAHEHEALAKTINSSIVLHLQKLKSEVKLHIRNIMQDTGKLASLVATEREKSTKLITGLAKAITLAKSASLSHDWRQDPWYCNQLVLEQLHKQVHEENILQKSILIMQTHSAQFEEALLRAIQTAWATYEEYNKRMLSEAQHQWSMSADWFRTITPTTEWEAFSDRDDCLLDRKTPLRDHQKINYPGIADSSTSAVCQGYLQRKKRYTKAYKEGYFVLTPAGFLHEFKSSNLTRNQIPELSIFLLECTLGAPASQHSRSHKFSLIVDKKGRLNREQEYTFRAKSYSELMGWWNKLKELVKVYLLSSAPLDRTGPVPAAVRTVGYDSADDSDGNGQEEEDVRNGDVGDQESGSSIEKESSVDEPIQPVSPSPAQATSPRPNFLKEKHAMNDKSPAYTDNGGIGIDTVPAELMGKKSQYNKEDFGSKATRESEDRAQSDSNSSSPEEPPHPINKGNSLGLMLSKFTENFT